MTQENDDQRSLLNQVVQRDEAACSRFYRLHVGYLYAVSTKARCFRGLSQNEIERFVRHALTVATLTASHLLAVQNPRPISRTLVRAWLGRILVSLVRNSHGIALAQRSAVNEVYDLWANGHVERCGRAIEAFAALPELQKRVLLELHRSCEPQTGELRLSPEQSSELAGRLGIEEEELLAIRERALLQIENYIRERL